MNIKEKARVFATAAHGAINHRRKYTGEPYIVHPVEVAEIVEFNYRFDATISLDHIKSIDYVIAASYLHDVIEDTAITEENLLNEFPFGVVRLVVELTNVSKPEDGNRKARKTLDLMKTACTSFDAKMIRLADITSNIRTIFSCDRGFARVYVAEKLAMLDVMKECKETKLFKELETSLILMQQELKKSEELAHVNH
jgi:(p)ppGpp synthase/HD superfamily hydrolase